VDAANKLVLPLVCLCWLMPAALVRAESPLRLGSQMVPLGMFFHGSTVHAHGTVPAGYQLAVVCTGPKGELKLKRKERVLGLVWLTRGEVTFARVPSLYIVDASAELEQLAPQPTLDRLGVGYSSLKADATNEPPRDQRASELFAELLRLKEREKLFGVDQHGVRLQEPKAGLVNWSTDIQLPPKLLPGDYVVRLYGFRAGNGELLDSRLLNVRQVGAVAAISAFARKWGLLYGIGAVLIALVAGLLTGMAFGRGAKGGH
jgi:uncharacterized protein (TIGR02186 family)